MFLTKGKWHDNLPAWKMTQDRLDRMGMVNATMRTGADGCHQDHGHRKLASCRPAGGADQAQQIDRVQNVIPELDL